MANYNTNPGCGCNTKMPQRSDAYMPPKPQHPMAGRPPMPRRYQGTMNKEDPLAGMAIAMAYVPWQFMHETYDLDKALHCGTIFPELNKPFYGKGGCPK